jgi:hypothetical protein
MIPLERTPLTLGQDVIESKKTAKFLGVLIDNELRWKEQGTAALERGQDQIVQFRRVTKPTQGVTAEQMRKLYISIVIPRMLYATDVFLGPQ